MKTPLCCHITPNSKTSNSLRWPEWLAKLTVALVLACGTALPAQAQVSLVTTGAVWKYVDNGSDLGTGWRAPGFVDAAWPSGPAELGFGDGDEATTNTSGFITYYYRHTFNVPNPSSVTNLRAMLLRDDGAVVYLNGTEVFRSNMPTGEVTSATLASGNAVEGRIFEPANVNAGLLVSGDNVVAVEVHQSAAASSDVSFDFELTGNPRPLISINSPTNDQVVLGQTLVISGTAVPAGPNVTLVEAFAGTTKVGESVNANFSIAWQNVTPGSYVLRAKVTDSVGMVATSAPVNITVQALPASVLVAPGSVWKFLDNGVDQGTGWTNLVFDDSAWRSGPAQLGYGDGDEATLISFGPDSANKYPTYYFRRTFVLDNPSAYEGLTLTHLADDGALFYLNGVEVARVRMPDGPISYTSLSTSAADYDWETLSFNSSMLVAGANIVAVEVHQANATSSDVSLDVRLEGVVDNVAPTVLDIDPAVGAIVLELKFINVIFTENVSGVDASDLTINGEAATNVTVNTPRDYTFYFPQPATGAVQVAWAFNTGIKDLSPLGNPFAGGAGWGYTFDPNASTKPNVIISEFMADNANGIEDEEGTKSDWIEIYNIGPLEVNLTGWFLTDTKTNLTQWKFPSVILDANKYLLVWASGRGTNGPTPLHTNFRLSNNGEYLALVDPTTNVISEFDPVFPEQFSDVSFGRDRVDQNLLGYFTTPTPRAQNSTSGTGFAPEPVFSFESGIYTNATISIAITTATPATIRYTLDSSNPTNNSPTYTAPLTVGTNVVIKARAYPPAGQVDVWPSRVVAKTYFFLDDTTRGFTSKLPILIMSTSGRAIPANVAPGGARAKGAFAVIDTFRGMASLQGKPDLLTTAEFEIYGQTSAGFPKLPYNIEIQDEVGNDKAVSVLGMPAEADWKTRNPYTDKCLMNDFLTFELFEKMGHYSLRRRMVEVFVDSTTGGRLAYATDYHGVEVLLERIERGKDRVDIAELAPSMTNEPAITGGYIWKKDKDSLGDLNFATAGGGGFAAEGLKMHEPKPRELNNNANHPQVVWLRNYLNRMETCLYATDWLTRAGTNHYSYHLDVDSLVDQHWIVEFPKQIDGYRLSNYMYKDRGGKIKMEPVWDWNLAFGNANYLKGGRTNGWYWNEQDEGMTSAEHIWLRRLLYGVPNIINAGATDNPTSITNSGDPQFIQKMIDRWGELRTNVFYGSNVLARIDELASLLSEAAVRDNTRFPRWGTYIWPNPNGPPSWHVDYQNPRTYQGIIDEMKKWTLGRYLWLDGQFVKAPAVNHPGGFLPPNFVLAMTAPAGTVYYTLDGTDPRAPGGGVAASARVYSSGVGIDSNVLVFARARNTSAIYPWSPPTLTPMHVAIPALRITEVMYHPADPPQPSSLLDEDFEYIELKNTGATPLNLNGYRLSGGVDFLFPNLLLNGGDYVLVVRNRVAFEARYGTGRLIAGEYTNNLNNAGEQLVLQGRMREPILDFAFDSDWYPITDGNGFSLVVVDEGAPTSSWGLASQWRISAGNGSPGQGDGGIPTFPPVVISEALTHTDLPVTDSIELQNLSGNVANIGGWFLSDDFLTPKKYRIQDGTTIPGNGFRVFTEAEFNTPSDAPTAFSLSSLGDEVYLFSADAAGNLTGYYHGFSFGAQLNGITFGRHVTSVGEEHFVSQSANTLSNANSGPLISQVGLSEIMYRPQEVFANGAYWNNTEDEFIELHNRNDEPVSLYHVSYPSNAWRLNGAVEFAFPPSTSIPGGGYLLVVNFNPFKDAAQSNAFRSKYNVPASVPLLGPYQGNLSNDDEALELERPDAPVAIGPDAGTVPYVLVEQVHYRDSAPWPAAADGAGFALHRIQAAQYADDPANWAGSSPSPGRVYTAGPAPSIVTQPQGQIVIAGNPVTHSVLPGGQGPFRFQWQYNGENISGASNANYTIDTVQPPNAGDYQVVVMNSFSSVISSPAHLTVLVGVSISEQPRSQVVPAGTNVTLFVSASSPSTITYQWRFNGQDIPGATTPVLTINNVTNIHDGLYSVLCTDTLGPVISQPARLTVLIPGIMLAPVPALNVTAVVGETVNLGAQLHGTLPMFVRWRLFRTTGGGAIIEDQTVNTLQSFLTFTVAANSAGRYTLILTNLAGGSFAVVTATNTILTVLADNDGDKIPDVYEVANGMNTNDVNDAQADADGDTYTNQEEYTAGTDPRDANSYLKVDSIAPTGGASLRFMAVANRTYTVEYKDDLNGVIWSRLADVVPKSTTRLETVVDPAPAATRVYRLVTPRTP